jgi:hypothetical protein
VNKENLCPVECEGCDRRMIRPGLLDLKQFFLCNCYEFPQSKWENGKKCPMRSHMKEENKIEQKEIDPIKASKRKMGNK